MDIHLIYNTEAHANEIGALVSECLTAVASELDRGFAASKVLTPTSDLAVGIAMTPAVLRGGSVNAHIVLHAGIPGRINAAQTAKPRMHPYCIALLSK